MNQTNRRNFIKKSMTASLGFGFLKPTDLLSSEIKSASVKKAGMIGLDTGHSPAFVKALNAAKGNEFNYYKVVAAYPKGTDNILEWKKNIT